MTESLTGRPVDATPRGPAVVVRELTASEMAEASDLLAGIWQRQAGSPVDAPMLVALSHGGNYVAGAFEGGRLVGVCVGFFATPLGKALHSQIAGVVPDRAGTGIGAALKHHQREWCRVRHIDAITWTFDPLVARNAYFNVHRLGVEVSEYLVDFYGDMADALNAGAGSDRILVRWPVEQPVEPVVPAVVDPVPVLARAVTNEPAVFAVPSDATWCTVAVPHDIGTIRRTDPDLAQRWRLAVREVLPVLLEQGWRIVDVRRDGHYVLGRT